MKFIEVVDSSTGRPISISLGRVEMFYPIVKLDKVEGWLPMKEVECGTEILLEGGRKVESSMLYVDFKNMVDCNV